ncbi:MAG: hypothetical protein IPL61_04900 [Myxococcales bacterium]|nr:hypothetical protein [Myxococcales bacterium]
MLMTVTDAGAPAHGRRYEYDRLARMTCEVAGDPETSGACATSNPAVLGRFTYHDGASTSAPPAHRATMFTRTPYHAATAAESAAYTPWTNRAQSVQRGNDTLVITYDGLGRRTADYLASQPVASRRDYAYSPDGHLHTTTTSAGTVTLTYGIGGELMSIAGPAETADLLYDDGGRLVAAQVITDGTELDWEYHYLGDLPIAATRRRDLGDGPTADRLGFLHDRRGLITHVVTTKGDSLYEADHDAAGVASVDRHARFLWMPFALPGQLVLADTAATGRGPLAANGARAYDADLGIFLAPDPADPVARIGPEGYAYARNNPLHFADPSGGAAMTYWDTDDHPFYGPGRSFFFESGQASCTPDQRADVQAAIRVAIEEIEKCTNGVCGPLSGALRARWLFSLSVGSYACAAMTNGANGGEAVVRGKRFIIDSDGRISNHGWALTMSGPEPEKDPRGLLRNKVTLFGAGPTCLAKLVAHEALHPALASLRADELFQAAPIPSLAFLANIATNTRTDGATSFVSNRFPNSMFPNPRDATGKKLEYERNADEGYVVDAIKNCINRCR